MNQSDDLPGAVTDLVMPERDGGYQKGLETRELILRTALRLVMDEGVAAMSMRKIASACGIKFGNLTYHFSTREDLVGELLDAVMRSYEREIVAIARKAEIAADERLRQICMLILGDVASKKKTLAFPELWVWSNREPFVQARMQELYARTRAPLIEIIVEMRPDLDAGARETIALYMSGAMEGMTILAGHAKPFEERLPEIARTAVYSFLSLVKSVSAEDIKGMSRS